MSIEEAESTRPSRKDRRAMPERDLGWWGRKARS